MTTITLTLAPYQEARLLEALDREIWRWQGVARDILADPDSKGSYEGAQLLVEDTESLKSSVVEAIRAGREAGY